MKMKTIVGIIVLCMMILTGCNEKPKKIVNYPTGHRETAEETTQDDENSEGIDGKTLNYTIMSNSGAAAYEISATRIGDERTAYPVYKVIPEDYTDEDLKAICTKIFDEGSIYVVIPGFLTQSDYVDNRMQELTKRKERHEANNESVPKYIEQDMKDLEDRRDSINLDATWTIPYQKEIRWIDLSDFFLKEMDTDTECRVCYVEGTIDGEYYRVSFTDYQNNIIFQIFKLDEYYDEPSEFYTLVDTKHLPIDPDVDQITAEDAVAQSESFMDRMGISGYSSIATYPAYFYGRTKENGDDPDPDELKCGYTCYFAREVNGKSRPYNTYIDDDFYFIPHYNNLLAIPNYEQNLPWRLGALEIGEKSGDFRLGYEFLRICVTDDGVTQCFWNSPSQVGEIETENAKLLDFQEIDNRARDYLHYYNETIDTTPYMSARKVDRVELGMARVTNNDTTYYMVPAWYYFLASDMVQVDIKDLVCVNAIDGSIINVETGGNVVEFESVD